MKYLIIGLLLISCGKQEYEVKIDKLEGGTTHTFSPDFKAFREYCEGKIAFENIVQQYTSEEYEYKIDECYYDLNIALPQIPTE